MKLMNAEILECQRHQTDWTEGAKEKSTKVSDNKLLLTEKKKQKAKT